MREFANLGGDSTAFEKDNQALRAQHSASQNPRSPRRSRRAALLANVSHLEREHVALLMAICELETVPAQEDRASRVLRAALAPMLHDDLRQVQRALRAASNGHYGTCEECHRQLPLRTLDLKPATTICHICAASSRRERKATR